MFDEQSIAECRAVAVAATGDLTTPARPRKFASGFHQRRLTSDDNATLPITGRCSPIVHTRMHPLPSLTVSEQEVLIRFHAHQITSLVGPEALLPELRCGRTALSTAITLFRRFFLSNSVADFSPRHISVAAAFLGAKLEESKIEVGVKSGDRIPIFQRVVPLSG